MNDTPIIDFHGRSYIERDKKLRMSTGVLDSNGKMVYENDIIRGDGVDGEVVWVDGDEETIAEFRILMDDHTLSSWRLKDLEHFIVLK